MCASRAARYARNASSRIYANGLEKRSIHPLPAQKNNQCDPGIGDDERCRKDATPMTSLNETATPTAPLPKNPLANSRALDKSSLSTAVLHCEIKIVSSNPPTLGSTGTHRSTELSPKATRLRAGTL